MNKLNLKYMKYLFIFLLISYSAFSETPPVILNEDKVFYEIGLHLDILEDKSGKLTIDDVTSSKWSGQFVRSQSKIPNFGFSNSSYWARVRVLNKTNKNLWILSHNHVTQDEITLYRFKSGWTPSTTGDVHSFKTREIRDKSFSFEIKPDDTLYFIKVRGSSPNQFHLNISSPKDIRTVNF